MADAVPVPRPTQSLHDSATQDSGCSRPPLADGATQDLDTLQPWNVQLHYTLGLPNMPGHSDNGRISRRTDNRVMA